MDKRLTAALDAAYPLTDSLDPSVGRRELESRMVFERGWQAALAASQTCVAKPELPKTWEQRFTDALNEVRSGKSTAMNGLSDAAISDKCKTAEILDLRAALSASDIQPMAAPDPTPGSKFMVMMDSALRHAESFGNANIATSLVREMILAYQAAALSPAPQPSQVSEQDKLDAERYRWLRANHDEYIPEHPTKSLWGSKRNDYQLKKMGALDQAIDQAIAASAAKKRWRAETKSPPGEQPK